MEHIKFKKLKINNEYRKNPFGKSVPDKDRNGNYNKIKTAVNDVINRTLNISRKNKFNPYLIMKIELEDDITFVDDDYKKLEYFGLEIVDNESKQIQVVFTEDIKLKNFKKALEEYKNGVLAKTKVKYIDLFNKIKSIRPWSREDKLEFNLEELRDYDYIDCYLWIFETLNVSKKKMEEFSDIISKSECAKVTDTYVSKSVSVARVRLQDKQFVNNILDNPLVFKVDKIKRNTITINEIKKIQDTNIDEIKFDLSKMNGENASICVIDSGISKQHPLFKGVIGESKTFYYGDTYSDSDVDKDGHGTAVASVCEYGEFDSESNFIPELYIHSAKIHDGKYTAPIYLCLDEIEKNIGVISDDLRLAVNDFISGVLTFDELAECFDKDIRPYVRMVYSKYDNIYDILIPNQMRRIVDYFYNNYNCKIFNLSQGDSDEVFSGGRPKAWACVLDEIQNEKDVVFVVSTGNYFYEYNESNNYEDILRNYPNYFVQQNDVKIIDPATSITSLTVGGIALTDSIVSSNGIYDINTISKRNQLSSVSRVGPGPLLCLKPEFVAYSGDRAVKTLCGYSRVEENKGLQKLVFDNKDKIFKFDYGTSFSAPYVSHILGCVLNKYNDASANLLRAMIASSAYYTEEMESCFKKECLDNNLINNEFKNNKNNICEKTIKFNTFGYGYPDKHRCLNSFDNRVTLVSDVYEREERIKVNTFNIFEIPLPKSFRKSSGTKRVIVSLAYNPPVKNTRADYKGVSLSFDLIKGKDLNTVLNSVEKVEEDAIEKIEEKYKCTIEGKSIIQKGTLQRGIYHFVRDCGFTDNLYLVIKAKKNWSEEPQAYALTVVLESSDNKLKFYNEIKEKINQTEQVINRKNKIKKRTRL
ncbi:S8 family serine peptidase [Clostridium perfringens]|uniref:S8 family peptidase n=1 Tax=Clostridium perfringens TaxID=1502 RepID=UPI001038A003|nr:S8 family peptidase [Clostridium perfringens]MBI6004849.1 S8 family peptidase [Clostridium perfringens]MBI6016595.1 S8 family peptidase [Clostridium perfringens]MDK0528652.1 S8 family peptidase [Clostridium perfringens]MDK0555504.1 S8 family peptidase [Clostridium perfringens]MDK0587946.1 S8 family peptidase [Clostridium perfringens]